MCLELEASYAKSTLIQAVTFAVLCQKTSVQKLLFPPSVLLDVASVQFLHDFDRTVEASHFCTLNER